MKKIIFLILLLPMLVSAQSFDVFDIDTSEYPLMKAKFYSADVNGMQIRNYTPADFEITENGEPRDVISVSCPENKKEPFSVVIAVDISGSMEGTNLIFSKLAIIKYINMIPDDGSEVAIIAFNGKNIYISDFSTNKLKLISSVGRLEAGGATDFNAAFLSPMAGALLAIENGKHLNKNIILVTDGFANGNEIEIINKSKSLNTRIFSILINNIAPEILLNVSKATNGKIYNNIITENDFIEAFIKISNEIVIKELCSIAWNTEMTCDDHKRLEVKDLITSGVSRSEYLVGDSRVISFFLETDYLNFDEVKEGSFKDTTITISIKNRDFTINDIKFEPDNLVFSILNTLPINVKNGDSLKLNIRYSPNDSVSSYSILQLITNSCDLQIGLYGWSGKEILEQQTLNLIQPNGGEIFIAGSDTNIKWKGISTHEKVKLNFSSDNGSNWTLITDSSIDLSHNWKLPILRSDSCLVSIAQFANETSSIQSEGEIIWSKTYGGNLSDIPSSIIETVDGSYIMTGKSNSLHGDLENAGNKGGSDSWVLKLNFLGGIIWSKTYGGSKNDNSTNVINSIDGGYIIMGTSESNDGDLTSAGNKGRSDIWVYKLSEDGDLIWSKTFGGNDTENASSIIETQNGDLIVLGECTSKDGDITSAGNKGGKDIWIFKLNQYGEIQWSKTYGGRDNEFAYSVVEHETGSLVVVGATSSDDFDYESVKKINRGLVLNLNNLGEVNWIRSYGGSRTDKLYSIITTTDGGYLLTGVSNSNEGDLEGNPYRIDLAYWVLKLDISGDILWTKLYESSGAEYSSSITQTEEGKFVFVGYSADNGVIEGVNSKGSYDIYVLLVNKNGEIEWQKNFGGSGPEFPSSIIQNRSGNYLLLANSGSDDGDLIKFQNKGSVFAWALEISGTNPPLQSDTSDAVFSIIMPEPVIQNNDIDMGQMIVGSTKDTVVSSVICNTGDAPLHVLGVGITGGDAADFLIPRGAGDFYLEKDSCQDMMFEFTPSALGNRTAVATIRTTIGDFQDTIHIRGVGIDPIIEATAEVVDFGVFELGDGKDTTVVLVKNVGSTDINITDTRISGPDMEQFTFKSSPVNYTIPAGEEKEFQLNYTAKYGGKSNSFLDFHYNGIGSPIRSLLFAEGIGGEVYPQVADAYIGETVNMEIYLGKIKPEGLNEIATNFSAIVSYNSTLLAPIDKSMLVTTEDNKSYIKIVGELSGVSQIATVPMKVGLGTADRSGLVITEFQLYNANGDSVDYDIEPGVGEFNVLGICEEGGKRLINPNGEAVDMVVTTDGLTNNARINLTLIETGQTDLTIFDQIGNKVETVYYGTPSAGQQEINLDLSKYTNGRYYIKLTTPTITKTEIIEVVR